ncbi:putative reverse transcriptase domain-containing protein [Tanacetum coccineum]
MESIRAISERFSNTVYDFFLGKRVAYLVVANYVRNTWGKYTMVKSMLNSSTRIFSFQFSSIDGLDAVLENGPWFIRNNPLILKKWDPDVNLLKEDVVNVPVWVKLHGVPVTAFSEDGLSVIATKLGTPLMLDSYTSNMCIQSWGRSSNARALIKVRAEVELKDNIIVAMPKLAGERFYTCNVRVEYEWKPPRCVCCKIFGHVQDECAKNVDGELVKNMKKPSQTPRGVPVGPNVGFKPVKQVYRQNVESSSTSTTLMVEKINKMERLIIEGKVTLVDGEGKHLTKVDSSGDHDSEDEVASVDNDMTNFLASKKDGYGTNSLLEQWKKSYVNGDYDFDPYDDDIYEDQDIPDKIKDIYSRS